MCSSSTAGRRLRPVVPREEWRADCEPWVSWSAAPARRRAHATGQYLVDDFPVLSAGPTPDTALEDWDFTIVDETGAVPAR
jgi:hypothetical protein